MNIYVQSILIIAMGSNLVLAGTYGTDIVERQKDPIEDDENYPKNVEKSEKKSTERAGHQVQGIYTKTIVWPVSYSYISANIQASPKEEALPKQDDSNSDSQAENLNEKQNNPEQPRINNHKSMKILYFKRPVLQGNEQELNQKDFILRQNQEPETGLERPYLGIESYKPVTEPNLDDNPPVTENSHNVRNLTPNLPLQQYENKMNNRNIYLPLQGSTKPLRKDNKRVFRQKSIQPLETMPELLLRPPPQQFKNRPDIVRPISSIQTGEYRNQNHQDDRKLSGLDGVEDKETKNLVNKKSAPWQNNNSDRHERVPKESKYSYVPRTIQEPEESRESEEDIVEENSEKSDDLKNSESGEKKHTKHKPKNSKASGGSEYIEHHEGKKTEKGEKGYKKDNKHEKAEKGHHKKEAHQGEYKEEEGHEKKLHKGEKVYGEHQKGEKGKKEKKYGEGKKHKKGHSTHGEHNIIKKDEYIKKTKFYDEDHGGGEEEEHGEFQGHSGEQKGGKKDAGHSEKGYHKKDTAKKGHHDKGHHDEEHSGYEHDDGSDTFSGYEEEHEDKKGKKASKKWEKEE